MKFTIKTLDHRDFSVQCSEMRTVWELKRRVCRLRGLWLHPEQQRILYAGQVLDDQRQLRSYCIDERSFLLMLPKKTGSLEAKPDLSSAFNSNIEETSESGIIKAPAPVVKPMYIPTNTIKENIMQLGRWRESEVRRALLISMNNPNRAIHYLTFGKAPFPKMITPPPSNLFLSLSNKEIRDALSLPQSPELQNECVAEFDIASASSSEHLTSKENLSDWNLPESKSIFSALEIFHTKPDSIHSLTISSNEHLSSKERIVTWNLPDQKPQPNATVRHDSTHDIERLVLIGFPKSIVKESYEACNKNIEETAILLFEQYVDQIEYPRY